MKIKIIDLLNKIANGEEVPKKVIYKRDTFEYYSANRAGIRYVCGSYNGDYKYLMWCINDLNDEVEIVEQKPKTVEEVEKDLKYVLNRVLKAFERNDCIDWNFTDIREKYGFDDEEEDE